MMETNQGNCEKRKAGRPNVKWIVGVVVVCGIFWRVLLPTAQGDIYWFQDEKGVVHISNVPVDKRFLFKEKERARKARRLLYEKRRRIYDGLIEDVARAEGLDSDLLRAVVEAESNYDAKAISRKGAVGLMQLMPETARKMGVTDPFHPAENLAAGARYLRQLIEKYEGKLPLALAAYNAGESTVDQYKGIPPYLETRRYVEKVLKVYSRATKRREVGGRKGGP